MITIFLPKKSRIYCALLISYGIEKFSEGSVPCSGCLLQPIHSFVKYVHIVRSINVYEPWRLFDVDNLFMLSIQERTLDVHLIYFDILVRSIRQEDTY